MNFPVNNRTPNRLVIIFATLTTGASLVSVASAGIESFAFDLIDFNTASTPATLIEVIPDQHTVFMGTLATEGFPQLTGVNLHNQARSQSLLADAYPESDIFLSLGGGGNGQVQSGNTSAMTFSKGSQMVSAPLPSSALAGLALLGSLAGFRSARRR